ncbi:MAG TPA: homocysteine S-methyltransferase family protein, partial [Gemmatimonadaceae bacterium]|nr:homocysteine S-methyltransferase family protein [Gemmatimonadaceae bacterium]
MAESSGSSPYLRALERGILVYDGAMGTNIQRYKLGADDFGGASYEGCNDYLVITRPDVIQEIHESFLAVGCDVVETCTFQSTPRRLHEWGLGDRVRDVNVGAARIARAAADKYSTPERPRFVAGSMGPTGMLPASDDPLLSAITWDELCENYRAQAEGLVEGGVDVLLIETAQDILEVKAAIAGIERLFAQIGRRVPLQVQVTLDTSGRMLLGTDIASAMTTLEALGVNVIGLNCSTGPEHMREPIRYLTEHATRPVSCIPNAGLPINTGVGDAVYPLEPEPMARALSEFVRDFGVRVVGGCCGTTPAHLEAVVRAVREAAPAATTSREKAPVVPRVSSAMRAITLHQDPPPLLIGERVNAQGSRKVKQFLLADDYEGLVGVARQQVDSGAHVLDVCVALTERADEA